jgi:hypothetical protein
MKTYKEFKHEIDEGFLDKIKGAVKHIAGTSSSAPKYKDDMAARHAKETSSREKAAGKERSKGLRGAPGGRTGAAVAGRNVEVQLRHAKERIDHDNAHTHVVKAGLGNGKGTTWAHNSKSDASAHVRQLKKAGFPMAKAKHAEHIHAHDDDHGHDMTHYNKRDSAKSKPTLTASGKHLVDIKSGGKAVLK